MTNAERLARAVLDGRGDLAAELADAVLELHSLFAFTIAGNRRADVAEFAAWATACGVKPTAALTRFLRQAG